MATGNTFGYSVLVCDPIPLNTGERLPNGEHHGPFGIIQNLFPERTVVSLSLSRTGVQAVHVGARSGPRS